MSERHEKETVFDANTALIRWLKAKVAELEQQVARPSLIEPEVVWCSYDCPKADRVDGGVSIPAMRLVRRLDDEAGHQRVYCCPKCQREVSVNFPPSEQVARQETPVTAFDRRREVSANNNDAVQIAQDVLEGR